MLVENARIIDAEFRKGMQATEEIKEQFQDYCAELNRICITLADNWIDSRFGYLSGDAIVVKATGEPDTLRLANSLRQLNSDCDWLLSSLRERSQ